MPRKKTKSPLKKAKVPLKKQRVTKKTVSKPKVKKKVEKKKKPEIKKIQKSKKQQEYTEAIGRRKTSNARVRFYQNKDGKGIIFVNKKEVENYFPEKQLQSIIYDPIEKTNTDLLKRGKLEILTRGGGKRGQAEAIQLGIARVILKIDSKFKTILRTHSFLTRDSRKTERKKFGLKKARKAPQWQKR